ncbi:hypothetical protein CWR48_04985 [Oceanobacillus arenosus]|uniref:IrrE N-terminal-like domain-containing protein n=1 Tax=Oceanobacillus arenosus TaxID=1229153 RepID=A0A3D8PXN1_9BACI|nr:ImmA/IrrE family metallo-endopeptidase [Oceanobacillus arenosus]RDW20081.1 hypothetical protein CWR48_04985 [Oceanobacillus arenosus]
MTLNNERKEELKKLVKKEYERFKKKYPSVVIAPMRDSIKRIESLGILVLISAAPDDVSGFCMTIGEDTFIFVNKKHNLGRQSFSLWHEVYHWFTEDTGSISLLGDYKDNEVEFSADYFSSLVLIDDTVLYEELKNMGYPPKNPMYISHDKIIQLQHLFGVSYSAMVTKLIERFPQANLNSRYGLGNSNRKEELISKTLALGLSTDLINPGNKTYISSELFILLESLYKEEKISYNKLSGILEFIEKELD